MAVSSRVAHAASAKRWVGRSLGDAVGVTLLGLLAASAIVLLVLPTIIVVPISFDSAQYLRFLRRAFHLPPMRQWLTPRACWIRLC